MDTKSTTKSWVKYEESDPFPIQNLPFGVCLNKKTNKISCFSRISNFGIDLSLLESKEFFTKVFDGQTNFFSESTLNTFISQGNSKWSGIRKALTDIFTDEKYKSLETVQASLIDLKELESKLPVRIPDYTDFYSSRNHAFNIGSLLRPNNPLQPNWSHIPVGYHGRSSSIVVDGTDIRRPTGQVRKAKDVDEPIFTATKRLDYEVEMGVILGKSNELGTPIKVDNAGEYVFGFVMLNDWSARDVQAWEYVPLGPFLAKNFASTISAWIVTAEALAPFKVTLDKQEPTPQKYLQEKEHFSYDIPIDVHIKSSKQEKSNKISSTNYKYMYWTINQQIAHHSVTGCSMSVGDLLGSGTISGTDMESVGCLMEQSKNGTQKVKIGDEERTFLNDGDVVNFTSNIKGDGYVIGFGDCSGKIIEAHSEDKYY